MGLNFSDSACFYSSIIKLTLESVKMKKFTYQTQYVERHL